MHEPLNRRTFLKSSGVALALPWLEAMHPVYARRAVVPPKRMVFVCTALGVHSPAWFPKNAGAAYESTEYLDLLKAYRDDFTVFSGLSHPDQGGEHATLMTWLSAARNPGQDGFHNSISVDQYAAEKLGYATRFPSLVLSSEGRGSQSYTGSGVMIPAESSPAKIFARMFLQGKPAEIAEQKRKLREGRSILDELMEQTRSLSRKASPADRQRMDAYTESVRKTERDLFAAEAWLDRAKPQAAQPPPRDIRDKADLIGRARLVLGLVPLIIQSDSSRIVSIVIQDHHVVPQVDGVSSEHHNLSHHGKDPARIAQLKKIEGALLGCLGELLGRMKEKDEADGSLLDHTMTLFGSNLGNANAHDPRNLPILFAGGGLNHGAHVAYDRDNNTPLCNLFVRMLNEMKVETDRFATSSGSLSW
jgi:hypothetical protein